jgi:hypothetical protein
MSFSVGICGLPNVGKSTLFKVLTKREVKISPRAFTTIEPNLGKVSVSDERLRKIAKLSNFEKVTPSFIEFVDIAGLIKGAHKGEGLGNQFLSEVRNCDQIIEVIRCFENPSAENVLGEINPQREIEILETEFLMKDLETIENSIKKYEKKKEKKIEILKRIKEEVLEGKKISQIKLGEEEMEEIRDFRFLTQKPIVYLLNVNGKSEFEKPKVEFLELNLKEEEEMLELTEDEKRELKLESRIDRLILECYRNLDLITFFTIAGQREARAWTLKKGKNILEAAKKVHSDFLKFKKAEVIEWEKLVKIGSWQKAKELGALKIVGKDYILQDGDVIEFKL